MGGKRPDQYRIDPGEAGSTDYKFRDDDEGIKAREKHELTAQPDGEEEEGKIPRRGENPARAELKAKKARRGSKRGKEG